MTSKRASLGSLVQRRRLALGLSKDAAAAKAGMSPITWTRIEEDLSVRRLSVAGVERVLGWPTGSAVEYLTGDLAQILPVGPSAQDAGYVADRGPDPLPLASDLDEAALAERIRLGLEAMDEMRKRER